MIIMSIEQRDKVDKVGVGHYDIKDTMILIIWSWGLFKEVPIWYLRVMSLLMTMTSQRKQSKCALPRFVFSVAFPHVNMILVWFQKKDWIGTGKVPHITHPPLNPPILHPPYAGLMGCGAAEATGLGFVCFVVLNTHVLPANRVDYRLLFHTFSKFTPPSP
mgnify:CR=1 FL=1